MTSKKPKSLQKFSRFPAFPNVVFLHESLKGMFFFHGVGDVQRSGNDFKKKPENGIQFSGFFFKKVQTRPAYRKPKSRRPKILGGCCFCCFCFCCRCRCCCCCCCLLVGGFNPFEKIWDKMGSSSPIFGVNIKKYWSCHHPVVVLLLLLRPKGINPTQTNRAQLNPSPGSPTSTDGDSEVISQPKLQWEIQTCFSGHSEFHSEARQKKQKHETAVLWCREKFLTTILWKLVVS